MSERLLSPATVALIPDDVLKHPKATNGSLLLTMAMVAFVRYCAARNMAVTEDGFLTLFKVAARDMGWDWDTLLSHAMDAREILADCTASLEAMELPEMLDGPPGKVAQA